MNKNEKSDLAEWVAKHAIKKGADQVSVSVSKDRSVNVAYRDKKIETLQESTQNNISLSIYAKQRYSAHSTCDLRKDSLEKFIQQAVEGTGFLTEDKFRELPDPKLYPGNTNIDLELFDDSHEKIETPERVKIAAELEESAKAMSDKIISVTSNYYDNTYDVVLYQSNGFSGSYNGTIYSAGANVTVLDKDGGRPEDWNYATTRFFKELPPTDLLGKGAAERALRKIGQKKIESGKYKMLVENRAAARLLWVIFGAMSARSIQQKASYLDGMLEKKIASEKLTVIDDPILKKGLNSRLFDYEGIAAKKRVLIEEGILKQYFVDNYYGRKTSMIPNSGSTSNVLFEYGPRSLQEMIKDVKKGILVNGFLGGNSNSTTGDFSFGVVGLLVENGEIVKPVNEMNISGNSKEFWDRLSEVGNDPYDYSSQKCPTLAFEEVNFSGL
jgi:PmbA protein